jgi:hypothetical protein
VFPLLTLLVFMCLLGRLGIFAVSVALYIGHCFPNFRRTRGPLPTPRIEHEKHYTGGESYNSHIFSIQ